MTNASKLIQASAGNAGGEILTVEDVFSTYLYTGTGAARTITNNIDLDGEGGLVWIKLRSTTTPYSFQSSLFDTERGALYDIHTSQTGPSALYSNSLTSFNSDGFSLGTDPSTGLVNYGTGTNTYASWTFRKAEKFFDVVTYTGNGTAGRTVAHNLGSVPGCIIVKRTDSASDWMVYHKGVNGGVTPEDFYLQLSQTSAQADAVNRWNDTAPTSTEFTLGDTSSVNASGGTYVAYLFASDAGGFGDDGSESIIKCGSAAATGLTTVDCGFEPQWVLIKSATVSNSWYIFDSMRGLHATGVGPQTLNPNLSGAEYTESADTCNLTSTGFTFNSARFNGNATYIYIAIRRPMKTPDSGTEVFAVDNRNGTTPAYISDFPVDWVIRQSTSGGTNYAVTRMTGTGYLNPQSTNAEASSVYNTFDFMDGFGSFTGTYLDQYAWMFKRATGFFDVVAYTGDGGTGTINHNLGVVPEMIIVKARQATTADEWYVYHAGTWGDDGSDIFRIATQGAEYTNGYFASTAPTSTYFKVGSSLHASGIGFVSYLFASLDGVSKVGTFTPSASVDTDVDCGFSSGARFVLIKSSVSGDWYIWDSARGIVSGNDPYLLLNSTAAEVTIRDWIDPLSSGFTITSAYANSTGSANKHIFLAIA